MPRFARIARPVLRAARAAATALSAALAVAVLSTWAASFRRPLTVAFDARGERCRVVVYGGRASVDNAPQVEAFAPEFRARVDAIHDRRRAIEAAYKRLGIGPREAASHFFRNAAERDAWAQQEAAVDAIRAPLEREEEEVSRERDKLWPAFTTRPTLWSRALPPYAPPLAAVLLAVPPALAVRRRWRLRARRRAGRCVACGYDLRATPDRCPECGAVPAGATGNAEAQRR